MMDGTVIMTTYKALPCAFYTDTKICDSLVKRNNFKIFSKYVRVCISQWAVFYFVTTFLFSPSHIKSSHDTADTNC